MGPRKSLVSLSRQVELLTRLVQDVTLSVGSSLPFMNPLKDSETIRDRASNEGFGYLTKALPKLGKALDQGLETGRLILPAGFKSARGTNIPVFMRGIFSVLFDHDGLLHPYYSHNMVEAVRGIRQVCFLFYKQEGSHSRSSEREVIRNFLANDRDMEGISLPSVLDDDVLYRASLLLEELFEDFDPLDILPRHGPGSVATGERGNDKWIFKRKYTSIHEFYRYYNYFMVDVGKEFRDRVSWYRGLQPIAPGHAEAKVVLVPKDSRGPRLISMEPLEYQWIQQGLLRSLVSHVERHPLTKGYVNFTNQKVNQDLALASSLSREFATVDLKDASDRIAASLVKRIFPDHVCEALFAARSDLTKLPDGEVLRLHKFAPMGSAICFPILALTVWAIVRSSLENSAHSADNRRCYVYGDDLIVHRDGLAFVCDRLEAYGLRVNRDKTFSQGFFRESCGVDAWMGVDVTPYKVKTPLFGWHRDAAKSFSSLCEGFNALSRRGYFSASEFVRKELTQRFGHVPYGTSSSGFPCIELPSPSLADFFNLRDRRVKKRWNEKYQRIEYFVRVYKTRTHTENLPEWCGILKALLMPSGADTSAVIYRRRGALKHGWRSV